MSKRPPAIDFDNNWKEVIEKHVEEAVQFFLPKLHTQINWLLKPVFLEQEIRNIRRKTLKGRKKIVDKLIKVWLKTGEERWILIHIEIESSDEVGFNKRMFTYFSRAFDKYDVAIVALALLVGEKPPPSFNKFEIDYFGTYLNYGYNSYVVAHQNEKDLLASPNIFALFILANLYTIQTKDDMQRRLELKKKMYELAVERNIPLETMDNLLIFVFQIMTLPIVEDKVFSKYIEQEEKKRNMTEIAYQKKRQQTQRKIANLHTKASVGMYLDDMIEQMKKDETLLKQKDIVLKEKDIVLKEKEDKMRHLVIKLYIEENKPVESIAEFMEMTIEEIQVIINNATDKNKKEGN